MALRRAALFACSVAGLLLASWPGITPAPAGFAGNHAARGPSPLASDPPLAGPGALAASASGVPSASPPGASSSASVAASPPGACSSPLLDLREVAPTDPTSPLFHVNRWRAIPADFPVSAASPWTPCAGPLPRLDAHRALDLLCLPRGASLHTPEALRGLAWDSPAPPGLALTHDGLPVGHRGYVGFRALLDAALAAGHELRVRSGFRPHASQGVIFRSWVAQEQQRGFAPVEAHRRAAASSARAGHSEHQLGTTADLVYREPGGQFYEGWDAPRIADSAPMRWAQANAHRFGLVLSYPRVSTRITQYVWEPWHYRFVGVEVADELHRCQTPLEAFFEARYQEPPPPPYELP